MIRGRATARIRVALAVVVVGAASGACGDGTPGFCEPLGATADLSALSSALDRGDLDAAAAEAQRLRDLAEEAPEEIRSDFTELADAVTDIVDLLEQEDSTAEGADPDDGTDDDASAASAAEIERRRTDLNERFADLDRRGTAVTTWAARECGLDLS